MREKVSNLEGLTIISGGQTGADRAGLEVGRSLGLKTGGWAPGGLLTENGPDQSLEAFGLREHSLPGYPPRTRQNVCDSDLTVIFGEADSPGSALTKRLCLAYGKPFLVNPSGRELRERLELLAQKISAP